MSDADEVAVSEDRAPPDNVVVQFGAVAALSIFEPPFILFEHDSRMFRAGEVVIDDNGVAARASQGKDGTESPTHAIAGLRLLADEIAVLRGRRRNCSLDLIEISPDDDEERQEKACQA